MSTNADARSLHADASEPPGAVVPGAVAPGAVVPLDPLPVGLPASEGAAPAGRGRWRRALGGRFALTAADQCVSSFSNFAVGVAIARVAGIDALGAYSLAYVVWLLLADFHRSLVTDPMAIENDLTGTRMRRAVQVGLAAEIVLGLAMAGVAAGAGGLLLLCGQHAYGTAFVGLSPWLPFLLVQDYWRWVAFMRARPGHALANDLVFDVVQGLAFGVLFVVGTHSSALAIGAWGVGALAGALFGLRQHHVRPALSGGVARMRERWPMSRWLLGGSVTTWGASQAYIVITAALLGPAGIGGLRAALSLVSGPSLVLLQAGGSVGLPESSKALERRGWPGLRRVERAITAASVVSVAAVGVVVLLWGGQLLALLYGPQFRQFGSTADLLALSVLLSTLSVGAVLSLKAVKLTDMVFRKSVASLVVSVIAVVVMVPMFGVQGAAGAAIARCAVVSAATLALHWRFSRHAAEGLQPGLAAAG
ncbi:MAG: hypothetical protein ACRDY3_11080 [Acidimicrobiales bacterium]